MSRPALEQSGRSGSVEFLAAFETTSCGLVSKRRADMVALRDPMLRTQDVTGGRWRLGVFGDGTRRERKNGDSCGNSCRDDKDKEGRGMITKRKRVLSQRTRFLF